MIVTKLSLITLLFMSFNSYASVRTRTSEGVKIFWNTNNVTLRVNGTNSSSQVTTSQAESIINDSAQEWNNESNFSINLTNDLGVDDEDNNVVVFSTDHENIGQGIVAVTVVSFYTSTGVIVNGKVIVNDNFNFSANPLSTTPALNQIYLGDAITHEFGHLLGLSHGQGHEESMGFTAYRGQHSVSKNDASGVAGIYGGGAEGNISGRVIGGSESSWVGIFGTHVFAISALTGTVHGSAFSDPNGNFSIEGLPLDQNYYIMTKPRSLSASLPSYYSTSKKDFCGTQSSPDYYRAGFYSQCNGATPNMPSAGKPQGILLSSVNKTRNIGNVSIHCELNDHSPQSEYTSSRLELDAYNSATEKIGTSFVGYFTASQKNLNSPQTFSVDLSDYNVVSAGDTYLQVTFTGQALWAKSRSMMEITDRAGSGATQEYPAHEDFDFDGNPDIGITINSDDNGDMDYVARYQLASGINVNNQFHIDIIPYKLTHNFNKLGGSDLEWLAGYSYLNFSDFSFYLLTISVVQDVGGGVFVTLDPTNDAVTDNSQCADGPRSYSVGGEVEPSTETEELTSSQSSGFACGTIDPSGGAGGGPGGPLTIALGFILASLMAGRKKKFDHL